MHRGAVQDHRHHGQWPGVHVWNPSAQNRWPKCHRCATDSPGEVQRLEKYGMEASLLELKELSNLWKDFEKLAHQSGTAELVGCQGHPSADWPPPATPWEGRSPFSTSNFFFSEGYPCCQGRSWGATVPPIILPEIIIINGYTFMDTWPSKMTIF